MQHKLLVGFLNGKLIIVDYLTNNKFITIRQPNNHIINKITTNSNLSIISLISKNYIHIIDYSSQSEIYINSYFGDFLCCFISQNNEYLVTGGKDDLFGVYGLNGNLLLRGQGHTSWINNIKELKKDKFITGGEDGKICIWDLKNLNELRHDFNWVN